MQYRSVLRGLLQYGVVLLLVITLLWGAAALPASNFSCPGQERPVAASRGNARGPENPPKTDRNRMPLAAQSPAYMNAGPGSHFGGGVDCDSVAARHTARISRIDECLEPRRSPSYRCSGSMLKRMTIDERLDRLTSIVDDIAGSIKTLANVAEMHNDQIEAHSAQIEAHSTQIEAHSAQINANNDQIEAVTIQIRALAIVAETHDAQIEALIKATEEQKARFDQLERQWQAYINTLPKH